MVQPECRFGSQQPHTIREFLWLQPEAPIKTSYAAAGLFTIAQLGGKIERGRVGHIKRWKLHGFLSLWERHLLFRSMLKDKQRFTSPLKSPTRLSM